MMENVGLNMKSKCVIVDKDRINSNEDVIIDLTMYVGSYIIDNNLYIENKIYYPTSILIHNKTGIRVLFNIISGDREYKLREYESSYFDWIPIDDGYSLSNKSVDKITKIILKKENSSLNSNGEVVIYCLGYV